MTSGYKPSLRYNFAGFELEHDSRRLFRGDEEVCLPPLSGKLLLALVVRAPETLSYDAMAEEVWGGRYVSHSTITQRVKLLRGALGDNADEPVYIALVRGIGYRFIPSVERIVPAPPEALPSRTDGSHSRPYVIALLAIAALLTILWAGGRIAGGGVEPTVARSLEVPMQARKLYELGKILYHRRETGDMDQARKYFKQAIGLAPHYPDPWVELAGVYRIMAEEGQLAFKEARRRQYEALSHALDLEPGLVEARVRLAGLEWSMTGSTEDLQQHIDKALEDEPLNALALDKKSQLLQLQGDWAQALAFKERAAAQHPGSLPYQGNLANFYLLMARIDNAEETLERILDLHPNLAEHLALEFAQLRLLQSRPASALEWANRTRNLQDRRALQAMAYHLLGQSQAVHTALLRLRADASPISQVQALELEVFIGRQSVSVDEMMNRIVALTTGHAEQVLEARVAMDYLRHSPFLGWPQRRKQWVRLSHQARETQNMLLAANVPSSR